MGAPLTVSFTLDGTATHTGNQKDYVAYTVTDGSSNPLSFTGTPLTGTITIPAGADIERIVIDPVDDDRFEGTETVILTISASQQYTVGSQGQATVEIADDDPKPEVWITVVDDDARENNNREGIFKVHRSGTTGQDLTVYYVAGSHYTSVSGTLVFPRASRTRGSRPSRSRSLTTTSSISTGSSTSTSRRPSTARSPKARASGRS